MLQGWRQVGVLGYAVALPCLRWWLVPIHGHPISRAFAMALGYPLPLATAQE